MLDILSHVALLPFPIRLWPGGWLNKSSSSLSDPLRETPLPRLPPFPLCATLRHTLFRLIVPQRKGSVFLLGSDAFNSGLQLFSCPDTPILPKTGNGNRYLPFIFCLTTSVRLTAGDSICCSRRVRLSRLSFSCRSKTCKGLTSSYPTASSFCPSSSSANSRADGCCAL